MSGRALPTCPTGSATTLCNSNSCPDSRWGSKGSGDGQFSDPYGIAVDTGGDIYVTDSLNNRVQEFGPLPMTTKSASWGQVKNSYR